MNYILEIRAFYDWLEMNPMSSSAICLWHALMYMANKTGWATEFTVPISVLQLRTGCKKDVLYTARNTLMQAGVIDYRSRGGNQSAIYKMVSFVSGIPTQKPTQEPTHEPTQKPTQSPTQEPTINKLNKTKQNKKELPPISPKGEVCVSDRVNYKKISDFWNTTCTMLPKVQSMSEGRKKTVRARIKEHGEDQVLHVITLTAGSDFLCGRAGGNWAAGFDWIMKPSNFVKILEGNYANRDKPQMVTGETDRDKAYEYLQDEQAEWLIKQYEED